MLVLRRADEIFEILGQIENGTFYGRWHFSFDSYNDAAFNQFGTLHVFNDDTLSPGAIWPLHPHHEIEVVTYCAHGEFRHADEHGAGDVLQKGWAQHTTIGKGMYHSAINNRSDESMRFIQLWFFPHEPGLEPEVQQKPVKRKERSNRFLPLVSNQDTQALPIHSDAEVYSSYLESGQTIKFMLREGWGSYLYLLEGGPIHVNSQKLSSLDALMATDEKELCVSAESEAELLLVHVGLIDGP